MPGAVSDWAEPLVRYGTDRGDQVLIFAVLAAGAAGGDSGRVGGSRRSRRRPIRDAENQPPALVALAWMVAAAGRSDEGHRTAHAAEALARTRRRLPS